MSKITNDGRGQIGVMAPPDFTKRYKQAVEDVLSSPFLPTMSPADEKAFLNELANRTVAGRWIRVKHSVRKMGLKCKAMVRGAFLVPRFFIALAEQEAKIKRELAEAKSKQLATGPKIERKDSEHVKEVQN